MIEPEHVDMQVLKKYYILVNKYNRKNTGKTVLSLLDDIHDYLVFDIHHNANDY